MTQTLTKTTTYTSTDVENVVRRVQSDLLMIADSSGAITSEKAREYGHDVEVLAKHGHLAKVDLTLIDNGKELRAITYTVNTTAIGIPSHRPGGVLWPRIPTARLRIVLTYTATYTNQARQSLASKLKIPWSPCSDDTSHSDLTATGGRDYSSNSYGMQRKDWS